MSLDRQLASIKNKYFDEINVYSGLKEEAKDGRGGDERRDCHVARKKGKISQLKTLSL